MPNLRVAIEHAGTALLTFSTGLPVGDLVNLTRALFGQHGPADVKSLARTVERDLTGWIDTEYGGADAIEPALATLDDLLANHALGLHAVVQQHGMNEASVAAAIIADGERILEGLSQSERSLVEQLIERIYRRYLAQPDLLQDLSGVALRFLLERQTLDREEFDRRLRALEGLTIPKPPPFSIPQPVGDFKGYTDEIAAVQAALAEGSAAISAVQGIGGVGKTELAREVARRLRGDFPDGQILVDMLGTTQPRGARDAITDVLKALGQEEIQPGTLAADYRSRLAGKRVLILLDNVAERAGLDQLVPPAPAALLVTSRTRLALPGVVPVELERLSREAAKALVAGIVPSLTDEQPDGLAGLCADLPLALRVAGAYLQATGYAVDAYLGELQERRLVRLAESGEDIGDATLNPSVVLGHSYDRLAGSDAGLARLFMLLGVFPADFEAAGAAAVLGLDEPGARRQLGRLVQRGLVQPPEQGRFRLHDLLRELAEARGEAGELAEAKTRHRGHYLEVLSWCAAEYVDRKRDVNKAISMVEADQANIVAAVRRSVDAGDLASAAPGLGRMGTFANALGRREEALEVTEEAVAVYRELALLRPDAFQPELAGALSNLGIRLNALGRREEALAATEEAVAIRRELALLRPDAFRPELAGALINLGFGLDALGRHEEALAATEEAVVVYRELAFLPHDAFRPELAMALHNLGMTLHALGRREDALAATEEAVAIRRELAAALPDAFRPELAMALNNLGAMLDALGRREDALAAIEEAVAICRELAAARPDAFGHNLAVSLHSLSLCLDALDRIDEAQTLNIEAIEALRPTFLRHPQAVIHWMTPMCRQYVERCQKLGVAPDAALLGPIEEVFERLAAEGGEPAAARDG